MARLSLLFVFAALLSLAAARPCYTRCRFRFCYYQTVFKVGRVIDYPFTGAICAKNGTPIGTVGETGEARVLLYGRAIPISKWYPYGLKQKFTPSFFKAYAFRYRKYSYLNGKSGVGHETPQQNQAIFLHNKCFVLPIRAYQVLNNKKIVIANKYDTRYPLRDCVAFTTRIY